MAVIAFPGLAVAQSNKQSCTIKVVSGGVLKQSFDGVSVGSKNFGGRPAEATISATNSSYRLHVETPIGFYHSPPGAMDDVRFEGSYSATGATNVFEKPAGYETKIKRGDTNLAINMTAKKYSGSFPAGQYSASMTVRCE